MGTVEPIRNVEDIRKVENILAKQSLRNLVFFTIGTNCGLRISDILKLNVGDVKNRNFIQLTKKKTGKFKKFPINSKLKELFAIYTKGKRLDLPLFETKFGNRLARVAAYYIIRTACEEAGLDDKFGTHTMRKLLAIITTKNSKTLQCCKKSLIIHHPVSLS